VDRGRDELTAGCEQIIRAFDPCMSCASHFLTLRWMRVQRRDRRRYAAGFRSSGRR
jgi:coenzyme F420-reducing hydrogenase alpha subunit